MALADRVVPAVVADGSEMRVVAPRFRPDPALSHHEMETLQREIADVAVFSDDLPFDPELVGRRNETLAGAGEAAPANRSTNEDTDPSETTIPTVVAVDQAFLDDRAVGAAVALRGGDVIERTHAVTQVEIPYIPGLLAFREGEVALAALESLDAKPDLLLVDGSGRIHYREAGIATHLGVLFDVPAIGVAKGLLCGTPREPVDDLPEGERVPIEAGDDVTAPTGETIGYAVQTRQFDSSRRINPVYVSPGHRVGAETAADLALATCAGYKLPEPIRLADAYAAEAKSEIDGG